MDEFEKFLEEKREEPERLLKLDKTTGARMFLRGKLITLNMVRDKYRSMTCKMEQAPWIIGRGFDVACDKCFARFEDEIVWKYHANYCPNCGRKVVK